MQEDEKAQSLSRRDVVIGITAIAPAAQAAFPPTHLRLIEAIVDRLIPSDENGPGARESGVATYIDRSFAGALAKEHPAFTAGLAAIDALARKLHRTAFAELDAAKQDAVLTAMEANEASGFTPDSRTFFLRIRQLTLEGMFGDPFYGGNRNFAGWDLLRYPGPRMAVSADEQKLRTQAKPLRTSAHRGDQHGD